MKTILATAILALTVNAFADTAKECQAAPNSHLYATLRGNLKTDCANLDQKLKSLRSISEAVYPRSLHKISYYSKTLRKKEEELIARRRSEIQFPWTDDFPYLYGLSEKVFGNITRNFQRAQGDDIPLEFFNRYKNITDLSYLPEYSYYTNRVGICNILKTLPHLKTITIEADLLNSRKADKCLSNSTITGVIIRDRFEGYKKKVPKTKVIGIETFVGDFQELAKFPHLSYLGVAQVSNSLPGIETIYNLQHLTHLSIGFKNKVDSIHKINQFHNLRYLTISCFSKEKKHSPFGRNCDSNEGVDDVEFLVELGWLRHLNLSFNSLKDVSGLSKLKRLTYLKLRGNYLSDIEVLKDLPNLKYLDVSGNEIESVDAFPEHVRFVNLSGNKLKVAPSIQHLKRLEYLNLSNNPIVAWPPTFSSSTLKLLNLNGGGGSPDVDVYGGVMNESTFNVATADHQLIVEGLYHDYTLTPMDSYKNACRTFPIPLNINYEDFPALAFLTLKNNDLKIHPDLRSIKLRVLNLETNLLTTIKDLPASLEILFLGDNYLTSLPDFSSNPNLLFASLHTNNIVDLSNASKIPRKIKQLSLTNNLLTHIGQLMNSPVDDWQKVPLFGNNIQKTPEACPDNIPSSNLSQQCAWYLKGRQSSIQHQIEDLNMEIHNSRRCGVTTLDL